MRAQKRLYDGGRAMFPKDDPLFGSVVNICLKNALRRVRFYSDVASCKSTTLIGDDIFRDAVVDGAQVPAVTQVFFGISSRTGGEVCMGQDQKADDVRPSTF